MGRNSKVKTTCYKLMEVWHGWIEDPYLGRMNTIVAPGLIEKKYAKNLFGKDFEYLLKKKFLVKEVKKK